MEKPETLGQSILAFLCMMGCVLMLAALGLMVSPPDERVVYEGDRVMIVERGNGR